MNRIIKNHESSLKRFFLLKGSSKNFHVVMAMPQYTLRILCVLRVKFLQKIVFGTTLKKV